MYIDELRDYCMNKSGVTEEFPFDKVTLVFKVMGKMFCLTGLEKWERGEAAINVKCDPETAIRLRQEYENTVVGGYHSNKKHWNTIYMNLDMPDNEILQWIDHSYNLVVQKLSKKNREYLNNL